MTMVEESEYERGHIAGGIAERLDGHDRHLAAINGNLAKTAEELYGMKLAIQRLGDQATAAATNTLATAKALKEAEEARRAQSEQRWSPVQKMFAVVAGVSALIAVILGIRTLTR